MHVQKTEIILSIITASNLQLKSVNRIFIFWVKKGKIILKNFMYIVAKGLLIFTNCFNLGIS